MRVSIEIYFLRKIIFRRGLMALDVAYKYAPWQICNKLLDKTTNGRRETVDRERQGQVSELRCARYQLHS